MLYLILLYFLETAIGRKPPPPGKFSTTITGDRVTHQDVALRNLSVALCNLAQPTGQEPEQLQDSFSSLTNVVIFFFKKCFYYKEQISCISKIEF